MRCGNHAFPLAWSQIVVIIWLLATRLDRDSGWTGLDTLEQSLGAPVYLLNAAVRDRFRLERAPAVVEAVDGRLWVREIKP